MIVRGASPRPRVAARRRAEARWTEASGASNALRPLVPTGYPWMWLPLRPTATLRRSYVGETLDAVVQTLGGLPDRASIHLDRGYDSKVTKELFENRGLM